MLSKIRGILTGLLLLSPLVCYCQVAKVDTSFLAQSKTKSIAALCRDHSRSIPPIQWK